MRSHKGYNPFQIGVVDHLGNGISPDEVTEFDVFDAGTLDRATIYSDVGGDNSKTNPITKHNGHVKFWSPARTHDIIVRTDYGDQKINAVTGQTAQVVLNTQSKLTFAGTPGTTSGIIAVRAPLPGGLVQEIYHLNGVTVSMTQADTTAIAYGGVKLWDGPATIVHQHWLEGVIRMTFADGFSGYAVDATPEGDLSIGSTLVDSSQALGTDTSDDDIVDAVAYTMAAYYATDAQLRDGGRRLAASTDGYLNVTIDANELDTVDPDLTLTGVVSRIVGP